MSIWSILWIVWGAGFFAIEIPAIVNKAAGDTLSEHFRKIFHTHSKGGRFAWMATSGVFFAWFVVHIAVAGSA